MDDSNAKQQPVNQADGKPHTPAILNSSPLPDRDGRTAPYQQRDLRDIRRDVEDDGFEREADYVKGHLIQIFAIVRDISASGASSKQARLLAEGAKALGEAVSALDHKVSGLSSLSQRHAGEIERVSNQIDNLLSRLGDAMKQLSELANTTSRLSLDQSQSHSRLLLELGKLQASTEVSAASIEQMKMQVKSVTDDIYDRVSTIDKQMSIAMSRQRRRLSRSISSMFGRARSEVDVLIQRQNVIGEEVKSITEQNRVQQSREIAVARQENQAASQALQSDLKSHYVHLANEIKTQSFELDRRLTDEIGKVQENYDIRIKGTEELFLENLDSTRERLEKDFGKTCDQLADDFREVREKVENVQEKMGDKVDKLSQEIAETRDVLTQRSISRLLIIAALCVSGISGVISVITLFGKLKP